jgi:GNAT superfamily N-acetyltransferase
MKPEHPTIADIPGLRGLWKEAFSDSDAFLDSFFCTAFSPERCLRIARGNEIICAAYWIPARLEEGNAAYIYALATAKAHRGKGLAHRLCRAIHEELKKQGYLAAILVPGEPSLGRFYEGMGYRFFGGVERFSAVAEAPAAVVRRISGMEYAILRRKYLPDGGVIQEGVGMDFLADYAKLYAGEDFLLAAWQEEDTLSGLEFLGNREKIPRILQALGAKQGSFRCSGAERFAMWLPFAPCKEPTYFGLAFD